MNPEIRKIMMHDAKLAQELSKYRHKCKCGHTLFLIKNPYKICSNCGRPVFKNEKIKFIYKVGGLRCLH
jgi:hypothetical protein